MERRTVLVVDDDTSTRQAYAAFLEDCGYVVLQAAHGGEAIVSVYRHRPDVVVLDVAMPVLDGLETAESLRAHSPTAQTRIIAVSGCGSTHKLDRMHALCDDVLLKPCRPEVVESRIRSLVQVAA